MHQTQQWDQCALEKTTTERNDVFSLQTTKRISTWKILREMLIKTIILSDYTCSDFQISLRITAVILSMGLNLCTNSSALKLQQVWMSEIAACTWELLKHTELPRFEDLRIKK